MPPRLQGGDGDRRVIAGGEDHDRVAAARPAGPASWVWTSRDAITPGALGGDRLREVADSAVTSNRSDSSCQVGEVHDLGDQPAAHHPHAYPLAHVRLLRCRHVINAGRSCAPTKSSSAVEPAPPAVGAAQAVGLAVKQLQAIRPAGGRVGRGHPARVLGRHHPVGEAVDQQQRRRCAVRRRGPASAGDTGRPEPAGRRACRCSGTRSRGRPRASGRGRRSAPRQPGPEQPRSR